MNTKVWTILVACKADIIAQFEAPFYRLNDKELNNFLRALVIRYSTIEAEDMLSYYLNSKKGILRRSENADVTSYFNYELKRCGIFCGTWECYAIAYWNMTSEQAEAYQGLLNQDCGAIGCQ